MSHLGPSLRRNPYRDRSGLRIGAAILLSLTLNALWFWRFGDAFRPGKAEVVRPVALAPLSASQWEANRAIQGSTPHAALPPQPKVAPPPPPPEPEPKEKGQIVDVAPSKDNRAPDSSRFLSDRNNRVDKETRSRFAGTQVWENTLPAPSSGAKAKPGAPAPGQEGQADRSVPGKEGKRETQGTGADRLSMPDQKAQERLALAPRGQGDIGARGDQQRIPGTGSKLEVPGKPNEGEDGQRKSGTVDPRLLPTAQSYERIQGGPAPDKLDGVEAGEGTFLNTREFKYATYMNRIKQAVAQAWDPRTPLFSRDPDGKLFAYKEWTTWLTVTLDGEGGVKKLEVSSPSGLVFLDQSAVEAFRKAQPFLNPPRGMADSNGEIRFAFGFSLDISRSAGFHIQRIPTQY
jgi:TonB family protein